MFCHESLGSNEAIEHFPVGRRLAFDAAKGRLWAVCKACERWNLSPLEERWEAIEECERLFRDTKLRVSIRPAQDSGFELEVPYRTPGGRMTRGRHPSRVSLSGDDAMRAARVLLPKINRGGGRAADVGKAVDVLESARGTSELFARYAFSRGAWSGRKPGMSGLTPGLFGGDLGHIAGMPAPVRLALEMSLHEQDERRALEGELAELETRWREAEEVAAISDDMFLPSGVGAILKRLKGDRG